MLGSQAETALFFVLRKIHSQKKLCLSSKWPRPIPLQTEASAKPVTAANIFSQASLVRIRRPFLVDTQRLRNALNDGLLSFCLAGSARSKNNTPILTPLANSHNLEGKTVMSCQSPHDGTGCPRRGTTME